MSLLSIKSLVGGAGLGIAMAVLPSSPALAASSFTDHLWQFASGGADFITTPSAALYLDSGITTTTANLVVSQNAQINGYLVVNNSVHGNLIGNVTGNVTGQVAADVTRPTGATGSFQPVAGDLTYQGAAGGTASFHAGVMGHFHGDTLTNSNPTYHAGVIGGYSVLTSDAVTGPKAGVVGFIGADGATTVGDAGVMSVIEGDGGVVTANAAYGVQYLNSTSGSHFNYGLDLSHAAAGYQAVSYGVADIRLANGTTIASGATNPTSACVVGSLFMNTGDGKLYICTAITPTWTVVGSQT